MRVLERTIETRVVRAARDAGCRTRKLNGLGDRAWPDQLIIAPGGRVLFIEFKRPGGKLTPLQELTIAELTALGQRVAVIDSIPSGIKAIRELTHG